MTTSFEMELPRPRSEGTLLTWRPRRRDSVMSCVVGFVRGNNPGPQTDRHAGSTLGLGSQQ